MPGERGAGRGAGHVHAWHPVQCWVASAGKAVTELCSAGCRVTPQEDAIMPCVQQIICHTWAASPSGLSHVEGPHQDASNPRQCLAAVPGSTQQVESLPLF